MIFLQSKDLTAHIFDRFVSDAGPDHQDILNTLEEQNIALMKSKLGGRFDVDAIFSASPTKRHHLITKILTALVIYDLLARNAARKIPDNYIKNFDWANRLLEKINAGKEIPMNLPTKTNSSGEISGTILSGNDRTNDFYV